MDRRHSRKEARKRRRAAGGARRGRDGRGEGSRDRDQSGRAGLPVCRQFQRSGTFSCGAECQHEHRPRRGRLSEPGGSSLWEGRPQQSGGPGSSRAPPCWEFLTHGTCQFGRGCKFDHPPKGGRASGSEQSSSLGDQTWQPGGARDSRAPACRDFPRHGAWRYASDCRYGHRVGEASLSVPEESSSRAHRESRGTARRRSTSPCRDFQRHDTRRFGFQCRYDHPPAEGSVSAHQESSSRGERPPETEHTRSLGAPPSEHVVRYGTGAHRGCRYDHPSDGQGRPREKGAHEEVDARSAPSRGADLTEEAWRTFKRLSRSEFKTEHEMRMFLQAAWDCCQSKSGNECLRILAGKDASYDGIGRVADICMEKEAPFRLIVLPLLRLASCDGIAKGTLMQYTNPFLLCIMHCLNLERIAAGVKELAISETIKATASGQKRNDVESKCWEPSSWQDVALPVAKYCHEILKRFHEDEERVAKGVREIQEQLRNLESKFSTSEGRNELCKEAERQMEYVDSLVESKIGQYDRGKAILQLQKRKEDYEAEFRKLFPKNPGEIGEPPGKLRKEGPRHDNDHVEIEKIIVAPTPEEVLCRVQPYLPANRPGGLRFFSNPREAHRDMHYRLTRHDMVAEVQYAISAFERNGGIKGFKNKSRNLRKIYRTVEGDGGKGSHHVDLDVYTNARSRGIDSNHRSGIHFLVEFDDIPTVQNLNQKRRAAWWDNTKRLQHGTLVCLWYEEEGQATKPGDSATPQPLLGVICERNTDLLAPKRPRRASIGIRFTEGRPGRSIISRSLGLETGGEAVLIQTGGGSFFGYEPILKALKTAPIPFADYITSKPNVECTSSQMVVPPPAYICRKGFDLSCLATPGEDGSMRRIEGLMNVDLSSPEDFPESLLTQESTLDVAQIRALKAALTREVALIQGPPGTGKTYLGIQIVRVLVANSKASKAPGQPAGEDSGHTPLLCVSLTNHALDQLLAGLIESGVRNVLRLGGQVRREEMKELNVKTKSRKCPDISSLLYDRSVTYRSIQNTSCALEEKIRTIRSLQRAKRLRFRDVEAILKMDAPDLYGSLVGNKDDEDDFWWCPENGDDDLGPWVHWCEGLEESKGFGFAEVKMDTQGGAETSNVFEVLSEEKPDTLASWMHQLSTRSRPGPKRGKESSRRRTDGDADRQLAELLECDDAWSMSRNERQVVMRYLKEQRMEELMNELQAYIWCNEDLIEPLRNIDEAIYLSMMRRADVVGMTTSKVAAHQNLIAALSPKVVIVEEAAEVLESHVLTSLSASTEHLILIGDHKQLRPKVQLYDMEVDSEMGLNLDMSIFERLVVSMNLPCVTLREQRRMRLEISELIKGTVYRDLSDHEAVKSYPNVAGMKKNVFFVDHDHRESSHEHGRSIKNLWEAKYAVRLAQHLYLQEAYGTGEIAIITPYVGQLNLIREQLRAIKLKEAIYERDAEDLKNLDKGEDEGPNDADSSHSPRARNGKEVEGSRLPQSFVLNSLKERIRIATIDNFQGEEANVVILSLVRNGRIGFLKSEHRANVLLSRAKMGMYILGNARTLRSYREDGMWNGVLDVLADGGCLGRELECVCPNHPEYVARIADWKDFEERIPNGGCGKSCEFRLACGHSCPRTCHADDAEHKRACCNEPCRKELPCGHSCENLCHEKCGQCRRNVPEVKLPCGHSKRNVPCWMSGELSAIPCTEKVESIMPKCKHKITTDCCDAARYVSGGETCPVPEKVTLDGACGHTIEIKCGAREEYLADPTLCTAECAAVLPCGDLCKGRCGECQGREAAGNSDTGRAAAVGSARPGGHKRCGRKCTRQLPCGHDCKAECHQHELIKDEKGHAKTVCPPCSSLCGMKCFHSSCKRPCKDACPPCVHECVWKCTHRGACPVPCGAPCIRIPCDQRCRKKLACGCRCPGVCGEECPSSRHCLNCASPKVKNQVIDWCTGATYGDITEGQLNRDPIVVLPCGHLFVTSFLDGHMELSEAYRKDGNGRRIHPVQMELGSNLKGCPLCQRPIMHIRRYGRVVNQKLIDLAERAFFDQYERRLSAAWQELRKLEGKVKGICEGGKDKRKINKTKAKIAQNSAAFEKVHADCREISSPKFQLYSRSRTAVREWSAVQGKNVQDIERMIEVFGTHKPDLTMHARALIGVGRSAAAWLAINSLQISDTAAVATGGGDADADQVCSQRNDRQRPRGDQEQKAQGSERSETASEAETEDDSSEDEVEYPVAATSRNKQVLIKRAIR
ncbi:unnamed protein product [Ostreobium quekettii]|uniref:C3H1-type domain-containing protein n=1 Tax=Ostreobium quekettii TaxID=121088 RepID=A0A8S1IR02_9CHLO|nr:unnamed protein product [Ostreobium quekettii]